MRECGLVVLGLESCCLGARVLTVASLCSAARGAQSMCARLLSSFQLQQYFFSMSVASTQPEPTPILAPVPEAKAAAAPAPVPLKGQFMGVKYPLASFASTPHNVACISFLLGGLWAAGMLSASTLVANHSKQLIWSPSADASALAPQGLVNAIFSPFLGFYLASWAFFHLMEFVVTSMYNPGKLSVSCELPSSFLRRPGGS